MQRFSSVIYLNFFVNTHLNTLSLRYSFISHVSLALLTWSRSRLATPREDPWGPPCRFVSRMFYGHVSSSNRAPGFRNSNPLKLGRLDSGRPGFWESRLGFWGGHLISNLGVPRQYILISVISKTMPNQTIKFDGLVYLLFFAFSRHYIFIYLTCFLFYQLSLVPTFKLIHTNATSDT